ncbi:MAG: hypothetical protein WC631_01695 [Candidatus Paceibacterota bacterium]|jgi:hypothetical protein
MSKKSDMLGKIVEMLGGLPENFFGVIIDLLERLSGNKNARFWGNAFKRFLRGDPNPFGDGVYIVDINHCDTPDFLVGELKKVRGFVHPGINQNKLLGELKGDSPSDDCVIEEVVYKIFPPEDQVMSYGDVVLYIDENNLAFLTPVEVLGFIRRYPELVDRMSIKALTANPETGEWDRAALSFKREEVSTEQDGTTPIGQVGFCVNKRTIHCSDNISELWMKENHCKTWRFLAKEIQT